MASGTLTVVLLLQMGNADNARGVDVVLIVALRLILAPWRTVHVTDDDGHGFGCR